MTQVHETTQPTPTTTQPTPDQRPRRKPKATTETPAATPGRPTSATKPAKANPAPDPRQPKPRRSAEEKIADLLAEVERVKEREAAKAMRADPAVRLTAVAVRALNRALEEAGEAELVQALEAAKTAIATYLEGRGLRVPRSGKGRTAA